MPIPVVQTNVYANFTGRKLARACRYVKPTAGDGKGLNNDLARPFSGRCRAPPFAGVPARQGRATVTRGIQRAAAPQWNQDPRSRLRGNGGRHAVRFWSVCIDRASARSASAIRSVTALW